MKNLLFTLIVLTTASSFAQNFSWVKTYGSADYSTLNSVTTDSDNNIYTAGNFLGNIDFEFGTGNHIHNASTTADICVIKYDQNANIEWSFKPGNGSNQYVSSIAVDDSSNVYIAGVFYGVLDFDPSPLINNTVNSNGNPRGYIAKYDENGGLVWVKSYVQRLNQIEFDSNFDLVCFGERIIEKLDKQGNTIWSKQILTSNSGTITEIGTIDSDDNIFVTGDYSGSINLDPWQSNQTYYSNGNRDIYFAKFNGNNGNYILGYSIGGTENDRAYRIDTDSTGVYIVGDFESQMDFNNGVADFNTAPTGANEDGYLLKVNKNGLFMYLKQFPSENSSTITAIDINNDNELLLTGKINGKTDLNPGIDSLFLGDTSSFDAVVVKLTQNGDLVWANSIEAINQSHINDVHIGNFNEIYLVGNYNDSCDFDPTINSEIETTIVSSNMFITKWSECNNVTITDVIESCSSITWIDGNVYSNSNSSASFTTSSLSGCDSTVYLDLTITSLDTTITNSSSTLLSNQSNATYQWINCNNGNIPISGETNQNFTPIVSGNYAVIVDNGICSKTSACQQVKVSVSDIENLNGFDFKVFPNPVIDDVTIQTNKQIQSIMIYDAVGKLVFKTKTLNFNISSLKRGV